ncbi:exodeoxyribonuclease V subunit alpha [Maribrevibacterium harenarium]|uniref:RecBCD enzyme subunit RecD n=1 Tax=Maribrevibacterium harenarium TaxID=2589817 RepID=A0A501WXR6_9GAMM|nr:exodeoxyribonuclease V subunit alpha [Maribrevibacterium harenarium]TPE50686.1 exodeoxyribonuclease V subunit alpha [Maribrevibacterium harenarium]
MFNTQMLERWSEAGLLRYVDTALAKWLAQEVPDTAPGVMLAVALTSHSAAMGQVCLDLSAILSDPSRYLETDEANVPDTEQSKQRLMAEQELLQCLQSIELEAWLTQLRCCRVVGTGTDREPTPLVLVEAGGQALLYLRRYWRAEQTIVNGIQTRLKRHSGLDDGDVRSLLDILFAGNQLDNETDWQRIACGIAANNDFAIITGGPGTGKTTTVLRFLALLQGQRLTKNLPPLAIRLAAPTGKAAARLNESIAANLARLAIPAIGNIKPDELKGTIPTQVMTLHRLLRPKPGSRQFQYNKANPLVADVVVVDEASMIDIEMMAALFDGIEPTTRVVLLGDKDQLASVEAGYVLGDLCRGANEGRYTQPTMNWIEDVCQTPIAKTFHNEQGTMLNQAVAMLRRSYRFKEGGDIHQLATLVNEERADASPKLPELKQIFSLSGKQPEPILRHFYQPQGVNSSFSKEVANLLVEGYGHYLDCVAARPQTFDPDAFNAWGKQVLESHRQFQLLVALRRGEWGLEGLNHKIEQLLVRHGKLGNVEHLWYLGRPVMVTQNDYSVDLMNGDVGISLVYPVKGELKQRVIFSDGKGGVRWVLPSRLQSVETVFAMTVHKSQGSEFTHTALMLPNHQSPILTKELIYTGITRSVARFTLISGNDDVLETAMNQQVQRASGLNLYIR